MMTSFLPSTCLSLLENMDERLLDIEYTRVKHLDTISTKTRSKPTNAKKKDFLRSLLLQSETDVNQALEATILDALKSIISRERTTCKDVTTSARDDASSPENLDLEEHTSIITTLPAAALSRPAPFFNDIQTQTRPPKERPPPLGLPGSNSNPKRDILLGRNSDAGTPKTKWTLFLTDSVLSGIHLQALSFHSNEKCVRKMMYYLTDISNYEPELEYTDTVIVSAGINDLTRKYLYPEYICDIIVPQIRRLCSKYRKTSFIFSTILLTSCSKTNRFVHTLNRYIFDV